MVGRSPRAVPAAPVNEGAVLRVDAPSAGCTSETAGAALWTVNERAADELQPAWSVAVQLTVCGPLPETVRSPSAACTDPGVRPSVAAVPSTVQDMASKFASSATACTAGSAAYAPPSPSGEEGESVTATTGASVSTVNVCASLRAESPSGPVVSARAV